MGRALTLVLWLCKKERAAPWGAAVSLRAAAASPKRARILRVDPAEQGAPFFRVSGDEAHPRRRGKENDARRINDLEKVKTKGVQKHRGSEKGDDRSALRGRGPSQLNSNNGSAAVEVVCSSWGGGRKSDGRNSVFESGVRDRDHRFIGR